MSTYDDDDIEFDFFDEPETVEATQRGALPRLDRPAARRRRASGRPGRRCGRRPGSSRSRASSA